jgi:NAD(P)H-hydrate epimerase
VDEIAITKFGLLGLVLMENAGRGAADFIAALADNDAKIVILCGTGNNGGDGLVIARHLQGSGFSVSVWIIGDRSKLTADTAANLAIMEKTSVPCRWLPGSSEDSATPCIREAILAIQSATLLVDAMLGTGSKGELRGTFSQIVQQANQSKAIRVAIDVPTGLDGPSLTLFEVAHLGFETRRYPVFRARTPAQSTTVLVLESGLSSTITSTISLSTSTTS